LSEPEHPENFFDFDVLTGEILPKEGLNGPQREKALKTISDMQLNAPHHLSSRIAWLRAVSEVLINEPDDRPGLSEFLNSIALRNAQFSSITRALLARLGHYVS
jgi:hypothetical protein